ncbi:hypothetical protein SAMN05192554_11535 [Haloarchaeobius iranensis]|uniref:Uncharacterized protein n=1 Tax=Haloarchaeobius iranensis TaxID=996166 RepID=A0A1G9YLM1_9EURY|nr:hypothetical protein SAMN05192554_11535 [Haloarchaeobius iranensis]
MRPLRSLRRVVSVVLGCRVCVPASLAVLIAVAGVVYGLTNDDVVTALGALLFLPSAAILFGVAARRCSDRVPFRERRAN